MIAIMQPGLANYWKNFAAAQPNKSVKPKNGNILNGS